MKRSALLVLVLLAVIVMAAACTTNAATLARRPSGTAAPAATALPILDTPTPRPLPTYTPEPAPAGTPTPEAPTATPDPNAPRATLEISVDGDALTYDKEQLRVDAGSHVVLTFSNVSTINQHNWAVVRDGSKDDVAIRGANYPDTDWLQPDDPDVIAIVKLLDPGVTGQASFGAPPAGAYQFVCTFPGHNATMFGAFEVTG